MTEKEFRQKIDEICTKYAFVPHKEASAAWWQFWYGKKGYICTSDLDNKPDSCFAFNYTSKYVTLWYKTVAFSISPTGKNSFGSKTYEMNITPNDIGTKWKFENFEKWIQGQYETMVLAKKFAKEKAVLEKEKELAEDFK